MVTGARTYRNLGLMTVLLAIGFACGTPPH